MPKYIFVYLGGEYPNDPAQGQKHFGKYQQWLSSLGDAVVSPAIPFKGTHVVHPDGSTVAGTTTSMSGLSILRMESMEHALEAASNCPFLEINGTLEVSEMIEMPGMTSDTDNETLN